jgi:hypothetical protein
MLVPPYLEAAHIQDNSIRYEWDDWRTLPALEEIDEKLVSRLKGLSRRAVFAFMTGTVEWIYYRLAKLCDDPHPWDYLEAAWAMIIEVRYCGYGSGVWWQMYAREGWDGPIKGPLGEALERLEIAHHQLALEGTDPVRRAGLVSTLAVHVMSGPEKYKRWSEQVLERFQALYPRNPKDLLGDIVPRQAVDPESDFDVRRTEALTNQFLAGLNYRTNIFLSSPEGMLASEELSKPFQGTPYVFDIETDRQARYAGKEEDHHH